MNKYIFFLIQSPSSPALFLRVFSSFYSTHIQLLQNTYIYKQERFCYKVDKMSPLLVVRLSAPEPLPFSCCLAPCSSCGPPAVASVPFSSPGDMGKEKPEDEDDEEEEEETNPKPVPTSETVLKGDKGSEYAEAVTQVRRAPSCFLTSSRSWTTRESNVGRRAGSCSQQTHMSVTNSLGMSGSMRGLKPATTRERSWTGVTFK